MPQPHKPSQHAFFSPKADPKAGRSVDDPVDLASSPPPAKRAKLTRDAPSKTPGRKGLASQSSGYFAASSSAPSRPDLRSSPPAPAQPATAPPVRAPRPPPPPRAPSVSLASFRLPRGEAPPPPLSERTAEQEALHVRWQGLALGTRGVVPRRHSLTLDEAAAAEVRRAVGLADSPEADTPEGLALPAPEPERELDEDAARAADLGQALRSKYAAKKSTAKDPLKRGRKKKDEELGPSGLTYTPLEKQFIEIKAKWPDVLLLTEVGYKYKFHGDDAKTAAKELGIIAFPNRNFYTASIPTHRLHIHVKKLISLGYKVGVVSQMETAALKKAGDNRNAPFARELTHLYTAATYVEEDSSSSSTLRDVPAGPGAAPPPTNALVAVVEGPVDRADDRVRIALVSIVPGTGDVVWDEFEDALVRSELETRLTHLQPAELLLPATGLGRATEKVLKHVAGASRYASAVRVERVADVPSYSKAFDFLTDFYGRPGAGGGTDIADGDGPIDLTSEGQDGSDREQNGDEDVVMGESAVAAEADTADANPADANPADAVLSLVDFPQQVVVALAMTIQHMTTFGLQNAFRHRSSFTKFINRAHMLLSSNTLVNLEIYRNQTDGGLHGSLLWLLDHTRTRMGRRLMREWIGRPLLDVGALRARTDAVDEIMTSNTFHMEKLRGLLVNMPDLIRGLTRAQYATATPKELATLLLGLQRAANEFRPEDGALNPFRSAQLNRIIAALASIAPAVNGFLRDLDVKAARADAQADLWTDSDKFPDIQDAKDCISVCESELDQHLHTVRKVVKRPALKYVTVSGIEYLVEIPNRDVKSVPPKWAKISATKAVTRFHTPEITAMLKEREQHKETLAAAARSAFKSFQADIAERHELVVVSRQLAVVDCLISLATVALGAGYTKPTFVAEPCLQIEGGRHPMVETLRSEPYVPFDVSFSDAAGRAKVITGPNMAGKSSCVRASALIVCMAQIGSFVPAASVTLGIHDAVQTRMGASDELARGKSTFMVELSETSDILRTVTPRTLVILDELGRGTSTFDGVAIAYATLAYLADAGCDTLFVTHYPMVAEQLATERPRQVSNWHMAFDERTAPDGHAEITFLYRLTRGLAEASFGVWCARLAGLSPPLLARAQQQANRLRAETEGRARDVLARRLRGLLGGLGLGVGGDEDGARALVPPATPARILADAEKLASALAFVRP